MFEVDVYVDIKSPHSYLVVKPAMQLETDYDCQVNFKPYDLSYVDINVSTDHDRGNPIRRPRNAAQDRRARMYYTVARIYADAMNIGLRGPKILLSAEKANMGIAWALKHNCAANYLLEMYGAGWPNGWREYDMTNVISLQNSMRLAGMSDQEIGGFEDYLNTTGPSELQQYKLDAEESGAVGVPHIVFPYKEKSIGLFGREHLGLVRHTMNELGLEKHSDVEWPISHYWFDNQ